MIRSAGIGDGESAITISDEKGNGVRQINTLADAIRHPLFLV